MPQSATGQGGAFARPLAAGQLSAWRINLNKPRVFSMYKFSSLPRAISAATAMANWASSSSEDGGAAASRGRGPACLLACARGGVGRSTRSPRGSACYGLHDDAGARFTGAAVFACYCSYDARARGSACHGRAVGAWLWGSSAAGFTQFGRGEAAAGEVFTSLFDHRYPSPSWPRP